MTQGDGRGTPLDSQRREDLNGWDVLVVQRVLESDDPRKLWGSPVR